MDNVTLIKSTADRMKSETEDERFRAVKELCALNSEYAVPFLFKAVADTSFRVREEALNGVCSFPKETIFPKLESFLRDNENANLRNAAIEAFPRYGKEAVGFLLKLLQDWDEEVRMFSASILGDIGDSEAVEGLVKALQDEDENVRHAAAESLGKIRDARAVIPLINCLRQDFWIQYPAVMALGNIGDPAATSHLLELIEDEMLCQPVIEALGKIGDISAIPVLADILSQSDTAVRNDAIAAMVNIQRKIHPGGSCLPSIRTALDNKELIDHLLASLEHPGPEIKKNAIIALGWLRRKEAVGPLVELLSDFELEEYAVGALVSIGEEWVDELVSRLENPDPKVQASLVRCLDWIGHGKGVRACAPFLKSENPELRYQAVMAMAGLLEEEDIEDALLDCLLDTEPDINSITVETLSKSRSGTLSGKLLDMLKGDDKIKTLSAVQVLGKLGEQSAEGPLRELLDNERSEIRAEAFQALHAINENGLSDEIVLKGLADLCPEVRKTAATCVKGESGSEVEKALLGLLEDPDPAVRMSAVDSFGKIGSSSCVDHLIRSFGEHSHKQLRVAIIQAMGKIREKQCTRFLEDVLKESDTDIKREALESLGEIGDKRSVPAIIVALDDSDWSVRSAAIHALGKIKDKKCSTHLLEKLDDPEDIIKKEAIVTLGNIGSRDAVNFVLPLLHNVNLQLEVLAALERLGIPDFEYFFEFFGRSSTRLKCMLVDLLGRIKNPGMTNFLIYVLSGEFYVVRARAAKALAEMEDKRAINALLRAQKEDQSEEVRKEATRALKKLDLK